MAEKRGNKGEWSEIYVFLKLLGDKELYAADADLNKIEDIFYPILALFRTEHSKVTEYNINGNIRVVDSDGNEITSVPIADFKKNADALLEKIKTSKETTFSCPSIETFLKKINCTTIAQGSTRKKDIVIKVHDMRTGKTPELGFSIKSFLGGKPTLLNASGATNFQYAIEFKEGVVPDLNHLNSIEPSELFAYLKDNSTLSFSKVINPAFNANLMLIDTALPEIVAEMVYNRFFNSLYTVKDLVESLKEKNPLGYPAGDNPFYAYKIKRFLTDVALGMTPAKPWKGEFDATGGIIVVKKDGDVLCYHIYNKNEFENYLLNNTILEQAGRTKHGYGKIYQEDDNYFINLNLQIRFF